MEDVPLAEVVGVGTGLPAILIKYSHSLAIVVSGLAGWNQFMVAVVAVTEVTERALGTLQVGAGAQVMLAIHPGLFCVLSLLNLKVRHPLTSDEVKGPGIVVPQNPPANPPGTFPAALVLTICGEAIVFPSKTYRASQVASVSKVAKVTVTRSPVFCGQIVVVLSMALE